MLAYRIYKPNAPQIRSRNDGYVPNNVGYTRYIIFSTTGDDDPRVVSEPDFFNQYTITVRLSRKYGRFVVEKK